MNQVSGMQPNGEIILKPIPDISILPKGKDRFFKITILDLETTGYKPDTSEVIQLGYISFYLSSDFKVTEIIKESCLYNEPHRSEITEHISQLTGVTSDKVKGKKIDWNLLYEDLKDSDYIITHNISFDRKFLEYYQSKFQGVKFLCTLRQIKWIERGHDSRSLQSLLHDHGWYGNLHDALLDSKALMVLILYPFSDPYIKELIEDDKEVYLIFVKVDYHDRSAPKSLDWLWCSEKTMWFNFFETKEEYKRDIKEISNKVFIKGIELQKVRKSLVFGGL